MLECIRKDKSGSINIIEYTGEMLPGILSIILVIHVQEK